jgi:hypothetical protein
MKILPISCCFFFATALACYGDTAAQSKDLKIATDRDGDRTITIKANDREVMEYCLKESPKKPYLKKLFSPAGVQILRDSPDDHKHHHALMFALKADDCDFWSENEQAGVEKSRAVEAVKSTVSEKQGRAEFTQKIEWIAPKNDKPILNETRRLETHFAPQIGATLLSWHSTLEPAKDREKVVLGGDHFFGLGMRFVTSMDAEGDFLNSEKSEGENIRGSERLTPAKWCAYRSKADGKPVTVAIFDSPANPRHPNKFFTMRPFAYLAATLNVWKEPIALKSGEKLELTFGIAVWDGTIDAPEIQKTYEQWVKLQEVKKP